jgi:hypothetical protein
VPVKRETTIPTFSRATADEVPKSWELEQRVARLELRIKEMQASLDLQAKRNVALQAQFDHLLARLSVR